MLIVTPTLLLLAVCPVISILYARILDGLSASRDASWINETWWDRWYSWVIFGGPAGRWIIGTLLGVRELQRIEEFDGYNAPGDRIAKPGIALLLTVGFAILLSLFTIVSIFMRLVDCA